MATLTWDRTGEKIYETGDKKGVLFVMNADGSYGKGVAWNGLTAVSSNDSGAEETALWADDIKYAVMRSAPEYGGTIEAYQCPKEFHICDGSAVPLPGIVTGQQGRRGFGFSYVTTIGNDIQGTDYGYKIHLIYGASASPSERSYQTINDSPDAITLSWEFSTTPVSVAGFNYKPTSHIIIDSTKIPEDKLRSLEYAIYGMDGSDPYLPSPGEVVRMIMPTDFTAYDVGDEIYSTYKNASPRTIYDNPLRVVDIREEELEDETIIEGRWLQQKYATADAVPFSSTRAFVACPEGLTAGTYYITCSYGVSSYFTSGSSIQFTLTKNVPAGGRIAIILTNGYATWNENTRFAVYDANGRTKIEEVATIKGTDGIKLGKTGANANTGFGEVNCITEVNYGSNNYEISAIRQWLNSDKKDGKWWQPQDKWDVVPANINKIDGYLSKLPAALVASLRPVKVITVGNTSIYSNAELETYDLVTLPSKEQMYMVKQKDNEGEAFNYWQNLNGTDTPYQNGVYHSNTDSITPIYDDLKIGAVDNNEATNSIWLRSANVGSPSMVWRFEGSIGTGYANGNTSHALPIMFVA